MPAGESARARASKLRIEAERLSDQAARWDVDADGEECVGALLDGADRPTMRVLHDRLLSPADPAASLDHVVISAGGIFLIDAKNWAGGLTVHDGSLWQHPSESAGARNQNRELQVVRAMASRMTKTIGRTVTPVLCPAGDEADLFGEPTVVRQVHVVPITRLLTWLAERPASIAPEDVATRAVELSMQFPPAVGAGLTLHSLVESRISITPRRHRSRRAHRTYPGGAQAANPQRTSPAFPVRLIVLLVLGVALFVVGAEVVTRLSHSGAPTTSNSDTSPRSPAGASLGRE